MTLAIGLGEFSETRYLEPMKQCAPKKKSQPRDWLLEECEKLRQECNRLTDGQRRRARQHALQIIYGTDATAPAGRR